jgi:hypothetical protein
LTVRCFPAVVEVIMLRDGSDFPATTSRRQMLGLLGAGLLAPAAALALPGQARAGSVTPRGDVVINPSSFVNYRLFEQSWNYLYPWGRTTMDRPACSAARPTTVISGSPAAFSR